MIPLQPCSKTSGCKGRVFLAQTKTPDGKWKMTGQCNECFALQERIIQDEIAGEIVSTVIIEVSSNRFPGITSPFPIPINA